MNIAILGWGSLVWDKRDLPILGGWLEGGPVLPIEFARISCDGRLTLVIDERNGAEVRTRYARSACTNLADAISSLRKRENNPPEERIGFVDVVNDGEQTWSRQHHPGACDRIKAWAKSQDWDAVVWTALSENFSERFGEPYSAEAAIRYFRGLGGGTKARAAEYIELAPPEVDTPFRCLLCS